MDKSNLELFKQAINEGVSNKFDRLAAACTEEVVCSDRHNIAMRAIIYGKASGKRTWSPRMKRIVAIFVAAALLLTSCGIIFRNEIREVFDDLFVILTYEDNDKASQTINDIYTLSYVPDGYVLEKENRGFSVIQYGYINNNNNILLFEQSVITNTEFVVNSEQSQSEIIQISNYQVYHRYTDEKHYYAWSDDKYAMNLSLEYEISVEELTLIIEGITVK